VLLTNERLDCPILAFLAWPMDGTRKTAACGGSLDLAMSVLPLPSASLNQSERQAASANYGGDTALANITPVRSTQLAIDWLSHPTTAVVLRSGYALAPGPHLQPASAPAPPVPLDPGGERWPIFRPLWCLVPMIAQLVRCMHS
jgi:hypothetical protein